jgi:GTP-binding protein EngB required for normal cell division
MLTRILGPAEQALLAREREVLRDVEVELARQEAAPETLARLRASVRALDELFLIAVVGEFNSGKSAFINALLGRDLAVEGVTPTTSRIHLLRHGSEEARRQLEDGTELVTAPVELLREVTVVDTPGTNSLDRRHEALTREFVPRADLVLFVTSADRPLSESERVFLAVIREWGKKVVVLLNKRDILRDAGELAEVRAYVAEHVLRLLGFAPPLFDLSCRVARAEGAEAGGLAAVERHLRATLEDGEAVALKLANPLGVAARLLAAEAEAASARLELLAEDLAATDDIERQLGAYSEDVDREFRLRLSDIDTVLHALERRGVEFLDDTVRLSRLPALLRRDELRAAFERQVVADAPRQVEERVDSLIDWLVSSDLNQWQAVVAHVNRRRAVHAERMVGEAGGRFEADRGRLLDTVGRAARDAFARYDRTAEARRLAEDVQRAVTTTALTEAGAVGLGAAVTALATSAAADVTGLLAAGAMAVLGLLILPHRRRAATAELKAAIAAMRNHLMDALKDRFRSEAAGSLSRIRETVAPYTRFVRAERDRLQERQDAVTALRGRVDALAREIAALTPGNGARTNPQR